MIFSLFQKKKNECIEKEMDNLLENQVDQLDQSEQSEQSEKNKFAKTLTYLQDLLKI